MTEVHLKKGNTVTGTVERIDYPNKGRVLLSADAPDGIEPVLVKNVLPGEKIELQLKKKRRGRWEGVKLKTLEPGPGAEPPVCPHAYHTGGPDEGQTCAGGCGGCAYQGLSYEAQLELKEAQITRLLDSVQLSGDGSGTEARSADTDGGPETAQPGDRYGWEGIISSPVRTDYRNKMEFTFGDEYRDGPLALGLHKRGAFHDIVTADGCRICDPDFSKILRATLDYFTETGTPYYHRKFHTGYLRHLLVRKARATGEILVDLITAGPQALQGERSGAEGNDLIDKEIKLLTGWRQKLLRLDRSAEFSPDNDEVASSDNKETAVLTGRFAGILHTKNDRLGDVIADEGTTVLYGSDSFTEELLGLKFRISPFSFFQTNSAGAEVLYRKVREYLGDTGGKLVYDLYSGTGTIAQIIAPAAERVVGIEIVPEAVQAARDNARINGLTNCEFLCGDVFEVLDKQMAAGQGPDLIVLDPPREGVRPAALEKILGYQAERIVYVSCQITSLVRDLPAFTEAGYTPVRTCSVDMFPYTTGIETVIHLINQNAKS